MKYLIEGGKILKGTIKISGAKNAAMPILSAALLIRGKTILRNIPSLVDVDIFFDIFRKIGVVIKKESDNTYIIDATNEIDSDISSYNIEKIRGSQTFLGALLARSNSITLPSLGGCQIGSRPIDLHIKGLEALGADTSLVKGSIHMETKKLKGNHIYLDYSSVGATENLILAACLAEGNTEIENAAQEPEIVDMINFLNKAGAKITGLGSKTLRIVGVKELKPISHRIMPDRIEAGTYMVAAAITKGDLILEDVGVFDLSSLIFKLREIGADITIINQDSLRISMNNRPSGFKIKTMPYPGFSTDLQSAMLSLACVSSGVSILVETVFENRFLIVPELVKMGSKIVTSDRMAIVTGVNEINGALMDSPDLRGGAALVVAALAAKGESEVTSIEKIERGYERMDEKINSVGGSMKIVEG
jgi:UDP-N-acetylglucosamine 1-carboxyvinyltransferase